ncbi:MAG: hypothetical protein M3Q14_04360 [bacterium]|nr:hypothetical protein [bacterium]
MHRRGRVAVALVLAVMSALVPFGPSQTSAQSSALNLTTSPLPINLVTTPGETVTADLRVKNSGTAVEQLKVGLLKFGANDLSGQPRLAERETGDDYFDWVSFSQDRFTAEPNVWHTIKMTMKVPAEGALGYYYAVTFQRANETNDTDQGASLEGGTAVLVLLEVRVPGAKRAIELAEFKSGKGVFEFLPADFTVTLKNSGNIHLIPSGSIYITRGDDQIAVLEVNDARGNILPNSSRNFTAAWNEGFPSYQEVEIDGAIAKNEDGTPKKSLKWDLSQTGKLRFGKYTATALIVYDDGERDIPVEAVLTFWVIPWRILGVVLLILSLMGLAAFVIVRSMVKFGRRVRPKK